MGAALLAFQCRLALYGWSKPYRVRAPAARAVGHPSVHGEAMTAHPDYRISYEIYALVSGERVILHGAIPDRRQANRLLADELRLLKQQRYAPEVTDIGLTRNEVTSG
jgi:hypothetical protein